MQHGSFNPDPQTSTTHNRFELMYSETIIKSNKAKTSMKSLKLSKSTTTINPTNHYNQSPKTAPKKKLKSFSKSLNLDEEMISEFNFFPIFLSFLQVIDNMLYYVVSPLFRLFLLTFKLTYPLFKFCLKLLLSFFRLLSRCFLFLRSQLKKPIKIPHFNLFRSLNPLILVLDLDETLVHCTKERPEFECEEIRVVKAGRAERYFLAKRPFLGHFLEELSKFYMLVIFTSSQQEYADSVINHIDFKRNIKQRYYRSVTEILLIILNFNLISSLAKRT